MPTPLGHALGGMAAGWAIARGRSAAGGDWRKHGLWFAALGMFPDIDLLFHVHRGPTHSIAAALLAGAAAFAALRHMRLAIAAACAYATHPLLDWLGADSSLPRGVMALWPLTRDHYQSAVEVFDSVWRRNETPDFWQHNIIAVAREVIILAPLAWLAWSTQSTASGFWKYRNYRR
jgi:hypothetical protein